MKKTTKSLLCLLLVLVMALQFGLTAPAAFAKGIKDNATISLSVKAPLDEDGNLSASGTPGIVDNPGSLGIVSLPEHAIALQSEGLDLTPPEGFAVTSVYVGPSDAAGNYNNDLPAGTELADVESSAEITIPADAFPDSEFHGENNTHAYTLFLTLSPAEFVEAKDSTCAVKGNDAYYTVDGAPYLLGAVPYRELSAEHGTLTPHEKKDATCKEAGTEAYWECSVCGKLFSDAEGTTEISAPVEIPQLTEHGELIPHEKKDATCKEAGTEAYWECSVCGKLFSDAEGTTEISAPVEIPQLTEHGELIHVAAKEATATEDGNIEYWKCSVCDKYFSDANGENEITDKDSVVIPATGSNTYDIILSGTDTTWKKGSTTGASIEIDADFDAVTVVSVKIGDVTLASGDYETKKGSVIVTIGASKLETLEEGKKTVVVTFSDDKTAESELTIEPADAPATPTKLEITYDAKGFTKVYDGKTFDLEGLFKYLTIKNLPEEYKAEVEIAYEDSKITSFHEAGSTTVQITVKSVKDKDGKDVTDQFTCDPVKGVKLTITKRKITVETRSDTIVYNGKAWNYSSNCSKSFNPQPIMTYTDPKLGEYSRDGKTYVQTISIKYTASPKNMGTYDNKAELIIREKVKGSTETGTDVTKNYEITYKFGKIKITDSKGNVPASNSPPTGDANNIWLWVGIMAAAVILVVVILVVMRKGRKSESSAPTE